MDRLIAILMQDHPALAEDEIVRLLDMEAYQRQGRYLFFTQGSDLWKRLAYTHAVHRIIYESSVQTFLSHPFQPAATHTLEILKDKHDKRLRSSAIRAAFRNRTTDEGTMDYAVIILEDRAILTERIWQNPKEYLQRRPHLRPAHHPASIHPKLARALVNLSGVQEGTIYDPLCGVGGIAIEAGLMGLTVKCSDIDQTMIRKCRMNLKSYGIDATPDLIDALKTQQQTDAVVTELPFCRTTKRISDIDGFYGDFLAHIAGLCHDAVVVFPDSAPIRRLIERSPWELEVSHSYYIHRSLSKIIVVLRR